ncbi:glycosyltransferase family 4 protein [Microbacterium sp.]|uniref:glycosyltransferase family 4 protein n=1 Tax=Microbacterium sp. TaxID=51671 RepID=UPI002CBD09AA|nr:glycosyltransferase family 4 protein [Microbacterium sp.]HWL77197.1 glycosyltransferase family 4 protein [Microbacterium sp.]
MRTILVTRIFAPEPSAASQRLQALVDELAARGDVTVLTSAPPRALRATAEPGSAYRVRRFPVLRDRSGYVRGYVQYMSFDVPAFFRVLFARRADVLVVEPPPTTGAVVRFASAIRRMPYVYYAADIWSLASGSTGAPAFVLRAVRALERFALRGASAVIAVSDGVAEEVRRLAPSAAVTVVGHGVDERVFHAGVRADEPELDAVYVGTASEWHGAGVFVDALRRLAGRGIRPRVAFIGQGGEWEALRESVRDAGLESSVSFSGPVDADSAASRLRGARVALASVRPEIGYDFAVPTKMYSAIAVGTPVLLSAPEPLRDLVNREGLGWGCAPDADEVADALAGAVAESPSPQRRAAIAAWATAHIGAGAVARRAADVVAEGARSGRRPTTR